MREHAIRILGLCCLRGGTSAEKIRSPRNSWTLLFEGGTSAEKNRVQEILGLCCFKKLVILWGGPVKKNTLY